LGTVDGASHLRQGFVVDDDPQMRRLISKCMSSMGITVHEIADRAELELELAKCIPEVVTLDLSLGDFDAVQVLRTLGEMRYGGAVLLISGHQPHVLDGVRVVGEKHGLAMLDPLSKPFRAQDLRERLQRLTPRAETRSDFTVLESALQHGWLDVWYQPKIDIRTNTIGGAEALVRVNHPTEGLLSPAAFLPPPGDPLYVPLTEFVVRRALDDWATFEQSGLKHRLAINVPASVLQKSSFVGHLRRHLPSGPSFPGLIVEITEDEAISDPDLAREIAIQLQLYNVVVAIDDFGAGFSSLSRLGELPFEELKLDRSFVLGCADVSEKRRMCQDTINLAVGSGMTAVAEGVENVDDLRVLQELGFPLAQGYFFAKPMPRGDFADVVRAGQFWPPSRAAFQSPTSI
jgi:EAL domain-containing protein (putative c-di-GMP-specific phosphodiesterase class I)/CheY-like chemotaxis protein